MVFTSYASAAEFDQPDDWLNRIAGYTGILEMLSKDHTVFGIERINYEGEQDHKGVKYYFVRQKKKVAIFPFRIHRLVKDLQPDVVFINGFIFPFQIIQLRWKLGKGVKIIILHRSEKPFKGVKKHLQKMADKYVHAYFFASHELAEQWLKVGTIQHKRKIHEIIQGSSIFHAEPKSATMSKAPVFLWVGRLDANKDPLTVVRAFIRFLKVQPQAILYMIYQENELLNEVMQVLYAEHIKGIEMVGKVPHEQLHSWYNSADFIVSGSHYEGNGVAVCEAMSCGCIPVVTNIPSFRKMTGPGKCGLLYEAGSETNLLNALLQTRNLNLQIERQKTIEQFGHELSFKAIERKIVEVIFNDPQNA
jgi:glycosyltransferase involved in cell wall biosynthesis